MKKLGLVAGMGPESTISYYHSIVYGVQEKVGEDFSPNITIKSINVYQILQLCEAKKNDELVDYLMQAIYNLASCGAEFGSLSANTPHIVFKTLKERSPIELVSIIDATRD